MVVVEKVLLYTMMNIVHGAVLSIHECKPTAAIDDPIHVVGKPRTVKRRLSGTQTQDLLVLHDCQ